MREVRSEEPHFPQAVWGVGKISLVRVAYWPKHNGKQIFPERKMMTMGSLVELKA
jgi:hypothetical protein